MKALRRFLCSIGWHRWLIDGVHRVGWMKAEIVHCRDCNYKTTLWR